MNTNKRIIVCPLDWGLGHATRCIPVIRELQAQGAEVIIAADKRPLDLLKLEFPDLQFVVFPGYDIAYPETGSMAIKMFFSIPKILRKIKEEKLFLEEMIRKEKIKGVVSDNRYGLGIKSVPSVLILHQLMVKSPVGEDLLHRITKDYIRKFKFCWVPDFPGNENLSGDLAHQYPLPENARFVGPLSRLSCISQKDTSEKKYDLMVIISGPEPQRTVFENLIIDQVSKISQRSLVVLGKPESAITSKKINNAEVVSHLGAEQMFKAIEDSDIVVTRPGYSTIMDLAVMHKKAVFVPTPGQTEQEYLGKMYHEKKIHLCVKQNELNLSKALANIDSYKGFKGFTNENLLSEKVSEFLRTC